MAKKVITCDLDGTLCEKGAWQNYAEAKPIQNNIDALNKLFDEGYYIVIYTGRLQLDYYVTESWLEKYRVKYHILKMGRVASDIIIDADAVANPMLVDLSGRENRLKAENDRKELCICVSGGLDSYLAYHWAIKELGYKEDDIVCINFEIGHPYQDKEIECLKKTGIPYKTIKCDFLREEFNNVPTVEKPFIYNRNTIFASIGANLAKRVWIVSDADENRPNNTDKNEVFYTELSKMFTQAIGFPTVVESPFLKKTKIDTMKWALKNKIDMSCTTSCYDEKEQMCGKCHPCVKRFLYGRAAGLNEKFNTNPLESEEYAQLEGLAGLARATGDYSKVSKTIVDCILGAEEC